MDNGQLKEMIISEVSVERPMVLLAKNFIVQNLDTLTHATSVLGEFLKVHDASSETNFPIHIDETVDHQIRRFSHSISWHIAFAEALWALIHQGLLMYTDLDTETKHFGFQSITPRNSSGERLGITICIPRHVRIAPSLVNHDDQILVSDDLYLEQLLIDNLHPGVEEFIRQAVKCFRNDLYLPCTTMLGAANEAVWVELGNSLFKFVAQSGQMKATTLQTKQDRFQKASTYEQINTVVELFEMQNIFKEIARLSYSPEHLRLARDWANSVRIARNAIHYNSAISVTLSYDQVALRLLTARDHFRTLYSIRNAIETTLPDITPKVSKPR